LKFDGEKTLVDLYYKIRPEKLTEEHLIWLQLMDKIIIEYQDLPTCEAFLQDLLKVDEPWTRQFYARHIFMLILYKSHHHLELYKLVRQSIDDMGRMLYVNLLGWISVRNVKGLELAKLLYEDLIKNGYTMSLYSYMHLFSELLKPKRSGGSGSQKHITAKQRADFLCEIFFKQATSNILPAPHLVGMFIQLLLNIGRYNDVGKVYEVYTAQRPRSFTVDAAYMNVLVALDRVDEADAFYHEMFDHGFRKLHDGKYIGANDEPIVFCRAETMAMVDLNYFRQQRTDAADPYPQYSCVVRRDWKDESRLKEMTEQPDKEHIFDLEMESYLKQKIDCDSAIQAAKCLLMEHRKSGNYQKFYRVYERLENIGFYDIDLYTYIIWELRDAGQHELMEKVFENIKNRHLMLHNAIIGPYVELLIIKNELEAAEHALYEYLMTRKHIRAYEEPVASTMSPGYLFIMIIAKYIASGKIERVRGLIDLRCDASFNKDLFAASEAYKNTVERDLSSIEFIEFIKILDKNGLTNNVFIYALIIHHLIKIKQIELATYWYQRGCEKGFKKDVYMFSCGLQIYSHTGQADKFMELYLKGRDKYNIKINHAVLSILCNSVGNILTVKELKLFWNDALKDGLVPSGDNYDALIEAYWRLNELDRAVKVLSEVMPKAGYIPNRAIHATLLKTVNKQNNYELSRILNEVKGKYEKKYRSLLLSTL
jgi:hypothetical protein